MQYMLLIHGDEAAQLSDAELSARTQAYMAYSTALQERGALVAGDRLHPTSAATTVRVRGGQTLTTDGPFAETKEQLVGFIVENGAVPTEGAAVVSGDVPVGIVTSARRSPQLGAVIGMAWVPPSAAQDGATVTISDAGKRFSARIVTEPFFDPKGEVLRS